MPTFTQKPSASRQPSSAVTPAPDRVPAGRGSVASSVLALQRAAGNRAVRRLLERDDAVAPADAVDSGAEGLAPTYAIQAKLAIDQPGDTYEQDADRVADEVMRTPERGLRQEDGSGPMPAPGETEQGAVRDETVRAARIGAGYVGRIAAPPAVREALRSPGRPLDPATRAFMEPRFGYDFSGVRVHTDAAAHRSARDLNARAYATGHDIVFGEGELDSGTREGRTLLAHELTHVVQQQGQEATGAHPVSVASSGPRIAREQKPGLWTPPNAGKMVTDWLTPDPVKPPAMKPPVSRSSDRTRRTRVMVTVTGHASPRWKSARSNPQADAFNLNLSHQRENAVRHRVEALLREALPDQQLVFEYAQTRTADPDPLDLNATVDIDSGAVGSRTTLQEAGKAARTANDSSMRRVDLGIDLSSAIDTVQDTTIHERRKVSGATKNWAIKMGIAVQAEEGVGGGVLNFMLKNRKSGQEVEGWGEYGLGGVGASVPIPTIDMGDYENFTTRQEAVFSDFDYKRFTIGGFGFNALVFGWEWSSMTIYGLPGGDVDDIDVGGFVMGGAGIDIGSGKFGMLWLRDTPDTYTADVERNERKAFTSRMSEAKRHRVLFETGKANISEDQDTILRAFVDGAVETYQRGGVYGP